jgi:hypothetical protein
VILTAPDAVEGVLEKLEVQVSADAAAGGGYRVEHFVDSF